MKPRTATLPTTVFSLLLLCVDLATSRNCHCGYQIVNTTTLRSNPGLDNPFTDIIETNFQLQSNIDTSLPLDWAVQYHRNDYDPNGPFQDGRYGKSAQRDTVVNNPLKTGRINSLATHGGDPGLQMWVPGGLPGDKVIPMSEVATVRGDILYGSFRAALRLPPQNGTCGAFFWYRSDVNEIDVEFLSREYLSPDEGPVNLSLHSEKLHPNATDPSIEWDPASGTPTVHYRIMLPFRPDDGFHEYRFDWTPHAISYYADGSWLGTMDRGVPDEPGPVFLNHWSDGRWVWSGGPPQEDAVMTVKYVKMYFNGTDESRTRDYEKRCPPGDESWENTCVVPDQDWAPDGRIKGGWEDTYWVDAEKETPGAASAGRSVSLGFVVGVALLAVGVVWV